MKLLAFSSRIVYLYAKQIVRNGCYPSLRGPVGWKWAITAAIALAAAVAAVATVAALVVACSKL